MQARAAGRAEEARLAALAAEQAEKGSGAAIEAAAAAANAGTAPVRAGFAWVSVPAAGSVDGGGGGGGEPAPGADWLRPGLPLFSSEDCAWALHAGGPGQDALLARAAAGGALEWTALRRLGVPLWLRSGDTLRTLVDQAARLLFVK